jgi:RimJ/RimL family protein N-acetyltransferase
MPVLETVRLLLRPLEFSDAESMLPLVNDYDVAANTLNIPYPYPDDMAADFIARTQAYWDEGSAYTFAIVHKEANAFMGCIGLHPNSHRAAEMGYWLGKPFWGQGYATEAARRVLRYAFEELDLNRVFASHFAHNIASGRVMQKAGMAYEGTMRQHVLKWGSFKDLVYYAIVRGDPRDGK